VLRANLDRDSKVKTFFVIDFPHLSAVEYVAVKCGADRLLDAIEKWKETPDAKSLLVKPHETVTSMFTMQTVAEMMAPGEEDDLSPAMRSLVKFIDDLGIGMSAVGMGAAMAAGQNNYDSVAITDEGDKVRVNWVYRWGTDKGGSKR
jgi:uncharacterized protein (DUF885 family)